MDKNKKYKLNKTFKKIVVVTLSTSFLATAGMVKLVHDYSTGDKETSTYVSQQNNYIDGDDGYLDVNLSDEKEPVQENKTITKITLDSSSSVLEELDGYDYDFSMSEYYDLYNTLQVYQNTKYNKKQNSDVITNGNIDSEKLYEVVINNNEAYTNQGMDSVNSFFSEASTSDIKKICDLVAKAYNENKSSYDDINSISETLSHLKIFQNNTTSASAYVNDDLVFVFNPTMMGMFSDMQDIRGNSNDGVSVDSTIFIHEIMHLFQNASNDFVDENGIEAGFCRKYENVNVNSLWNSWLLEGAAELKMTDTLNTTPKNYDKKISYMRSYNLSRIFEKDYDVDSLVDSTFCNNIEEVFNILGIKDEKSKEEFLELMYSIEITQSETNDFWKYYERKNNITLNDDEKESLRMNIRTEVIKSLSRNFYQGLIKDVSSGKIKDLETVFFLLRLWEMDCCNHLDYTSKKGFAHAEDFLKWQYQIEKTILESISIDNDLSNDEVVQKFNNYHMKVYDGVDEVFNADLSSYGDEKENYIYSSFNSYSITHYAKLETMIDYSNSISNGVSKN